MQQWLHSLRSIDRSLRSRASRASLTILGALSSVWVPGTTAFAPLASGRPGVAGRCTSLRSSGQFSGPGGAIAGRSGRGRHHAAYKWASRRVRAPMTRLSETLWGPLGGGPVGLGADLLVTDIVIVAGLIMAAIKAFEEMLKGRLGISSGVILSKLQVAVACDQRGDSSLLGLLESLEKGRATFSESRGAAELVRAAARALLAVESDWVSGATTRQGVAASGGLGNKVDDRQVQVELLLMVAAIVAHGALCNIERCIYAPYACAMMARCARHSTMC